MRLCPLCNHKGERMVHVKADCRGCGHRYGLHLHLDACTWGTMYVDCDCTKYHGCYTQLANGRLYVRRT